MRPHHTHVADFYFEVAGPNLRERVKYAKDQKEQLEPTNLVEPASGRAKDSVSNIDDSSPIANIVVQNELEAHEIE